MEPATRIKRFNTQGAWRLSLRLCIGAAALSINSLGLAITAKNGWGGDSMNMFFSALAALLGVSSGVVYTLFNGTLLVVGFFAARSTMGPGSVIHLLAFGALLDMWGRLLTQIGWIFEPLPMKVLLAAAGLLIHCCGNGMFISIRLGIPGFESMLFRLSDRLRVPYKGIKVTADLLYFGGVLLLGGVYGVMTVVFALCAGPLISFNVVNINRFLLTPLGLDDPRNQLNKRP